MFALHTYRHTSTYTCMHIHKYKSIMDFAWYDSYMGLETGRPSTDQTLLSGIMGSLDNGLNLFFTLVFQLCCGLLRVFATKFKFHDLSPPQKRYTDLIRETHNCPGVLSCKKGNEDWIPAYSSLPGERAQRNRTTHCQDCKHPDERRGEGKIAWTAAKENTPEFRPN